MSTEVDLRAIREQNLARLEQLGFTVSPGLPLWSEWRGGDEGLTLRPTREIAARLLALDAIFCWCTHQEVGQNAEDIRANIDRNSLLQAMTDEERQFFDVSRAEAQTQQGDTIGWKQEPMWSLAWVLGMDEPPLVTGGFITAEIDEEIFKLLLPGDDGTVEDLVESSTVRPVDEVIEMHDLFYCAHNAVRNAQQGRETVPDGFDPIADGGTVHERRHALTWCLAPGVTWDDTDLST